jgi:hypothetical protein
MILGRTSRSLPQPSSDCFHSPSCTCVPAEVRGAVDISLGSPFRQATMLVCEPRHPLEHPCPGSAYP